jgi:hypothetical protein
MTSSVAWGQLKQNADDATKPLDPGKYLFKCVKAEHRMASTGANMIVVNLEVQGGPKHGKSLMNNFVFVPDNSFALAMWFRNFAAFGISMDFFGTLSGDLASDMPYLAAALVGRQANATVSIKPYQGQDRNQFDSFEPAAGVAQPGPGAGLMLPGMNTVGPGSSGPTVGPGIPTPVVSTGPGVLAGPGAPQATGTPAPVVTTPVAAVPVAPTTPTSAIAGNIPVPPDDPF